MYIKPFRIYDDGSSIGFGKGKIDNYCVYFKENRSTRAPLDTEYFNFIYELAEEFGTVKVYSAFKKLYNMAEKEINQDAVQIIDEIANNFRLWREKCSKYFTILYMAMVAEENYPNTKLGKRLKRLGIYQMLFEGMNVDQAANWSRGKPWREISEECEKRGF